MPPSSNPFATILGNFGNNQAVARITSMSDDEIIAHIKEIRAKIKGDKKNKSPDLSLSPTVSKIVKLLADNPQVEGETLEVLQVRLKHLPRQPQKTDS